MNTHRAWCGFFWENKSSSTLTFLAGFMEEWTIVYSNTKSTNLEASETQVNRKKKQQSSTGNKINEWNRVAKLWTKIKNII